MTNSALKQKSIFALPSENDELWRYTKPEQFPFAALERAAAGTYSLAALEKTATPAAGMKLHTNPADCEQFSALIKQTLESHTGNDEVQALHLEAAKTTAVLHIAKNATVTDIQKLSALYPKSESGASLLFVVLERGATLELLEDLHSALPDFYFPRIEFVIGDGARLNFSSIQRLGDEQRYCAQHRFHVGRDANLFATYVATGAKVSRVEIDCIMKGPGGNAEIVGAYLADSKRHVDFHPTQFHDTPDARSELYMKGALKDHGRAVYYGYIKVAEHAQRTDAYQTNRNLVLSQDARADSIPNLQIKANDVKCSHGASVGQVGADEMFYLTSRGLPPAEARELLVQGFFEDLLSKVKNSYVHDLAYTSIMERLSHGSRIL